MLAAMEQLEEREKSWVSKLTTLVVTLGFFFVWRLMDSAIADVLILIGVLFIHELGHYIGMRMFDYRNVTMFFIPFVGAAVSGQKTHVEGWKQAVVSLLGPFPGIFLGFSLAAVYVFQPHALLWKFASIFILLNASQLLPIYPLDGGRFLNDVLFVRSYHVESVFRALAGCALMAGGWVLGSWVLGVIGFFVMTSAPYAWKVGLLAHEIKGFGLLDEGHLVEKMPVEVAYVLFADLRRIFPHAVDAKSLATHAKAVWEKINARPPGLGATIALVGFYAGTIVMLLIALFVFVAASERSWDGKMDHGARAYQGGRYLEAESAYRQALKLAAGFGKDDPRRADSLVGLGKTLSILEKNEEAERCLRDGLRIRESALGGQDAVVADALMALVEVLAKDPARMDEAKVLAERADAIPGSEVPKAWKHDYRFGADKSDAKKSTE